MSRLEGQEAGRCSEGAPSALRAEHTWAQAQLRVHPACQVGLFGGAGEMLTRGPQSREPGSGQAVIRAQRGAGGRSERSEAGGHSERSEAGGWWAPSELWGSPLAKAGS